MTATIPPVETTLLPHPPVGSPGPPRGVVISNTFILATYYILEGGILFLLTLILARYLGVAEFGRLAFALSYGLMLSGLSDPGISVALIKFVARDPHPANAWISEGFSLRLLLVAGVTTLGLLPLAISDYLRASAWLLLTIVLSEQIRGLTVTYCALFRGFQVMVFEALVLGVDRLSLLAVAYWLLRRGCTTETIGVLFLSTRVVAFLLAVAIFRARLGAFHLTTPFPNVARLVREAWPLGVLMYAERVSFYFVPLILVPVRGESAAGLFQAAFKVVVFPLMLCGVVGGSLYPAMSAFFQEQEKTHQIYRYGVRVLWHALFPCAVLTLLFAPQLLRILYGETYESAAPVLRILTPYYLLAGLISMSVYLLPAINQQRVVARLSLVSIALNLGVGVPLIYWRGAEGAALGLLFSNVIIAGLYAWQAARLGYRLLHLRSDLIQWAAFAGSFALLWFLRDYVTVRSWLELFVTGAGILVLYGGILMATRGLLPEEARFLRGLVGRLWR